MAFVTLIVVDVAARRAARRRHIKVLAAIATFAKWLARPISLWRIFFDMKLLLKIGCHTVFDLGKLHAGDGQLIVVYVDPNPQPAHHRARRLEFVGSNFETQVM